MVRKGNERSIDRFERRHGGDGYIITRKLINSDDELNGKGRLFSHITIAPHSGIGFHVHENETEIYYVMSGKGEYNDNGTIIPIEAGDVTFNPKGTGHAIHNPNDEPLEIVALILYA